MVLLAGTSFSPRTVAELVAQIKAKPGRVSCGSPGAIPTVGCELLRAHSGEMIMVSYKGNAPALNTLVANEINILIDGWSTAAAQVKAGRVRAIASLNTRRGSGVVADLPTVAESIPNNPRVGASTAFLARCCDPGTVANARASCAGLRPACKNSTICCRNSGGYGGFVAGVLDYFHCNNKVCAKWVQLYLSVQSGRTLAILINSAECSRSAFKNAANSSGEPAAGTLPWLIRISLNLGSL